MESPKLERMIVIMEQETVEDASWLLLKDYAERNRLSWITNYYDEPPIRLAFFPVVHRDAIRRELMQQHYNLELGIQSALTNRTNLEVTKDFELDPETALYVLTKNTNASIFRHAIREPPPVDRICTIL